MQAEVFQYLPIVYLKKVPSPISRRVLANVYPAFYSVLRRLESTRGEADINPALLIAEIDYAHERYHLPLDDSPEEMDRFESTYHDSTHLRYDNWFDLWLGYSSLPATTRSGYALYDVRREHPPLLPYLLALDGRANVQYGTALVQAASRGDTLSIQHILDEDRVDPNIVMSDGLTALVAAARNGQIAVVDLLLNNTKVDPTLLQARLYYDVVERGHIDILRRLLQDGRADPAANNNLALRNAMGPSYNPGDPQIVLLLAQDSRVDPTIDRNRPLRWVAERGSAEIVRLLLANPRVDPTANNSEALVKALNKAHFDIVTLLLEDGRVDPSADNNYALMRSVFWGRHDVVKRLLQDPRVDPTDQNGQALIYAIKDKDMIQLLLDDGRIRSDVLDTDAFVESLCHTPYREGVDFLRRDGRINPDQLYRDARLKYNQKGDIDALRKLEAACEGIIENS